LYKVPRGTFDILPDEYNYWKYITKHAEEVAELYGYKPIETPVFEDALLFSHSAANGTDIVDKEMYVFKDRGNQPLALKAEGTAPVCRAYIEHGLFNLPQPVKLYYITPVFRYERPQAGRYRQHHQCGFEAIGDADPLLDAEVIALSKQFLRSLGIAEFTFQLNSIGCQRCRPDHIDALVQYYSRFKDEICSDCRIRLTQNPLRLLDCKQERCQQLAYNAPKTIEFLCSECAEHFQAVQHYLKELGISFYIKHRLVRGLDYYTKTVFEIEPYEEKSQSVLGGGGRYDNLIEHLGGKPTPGIGFATGIERLILNVRRQGVQVLNPTPPTAFIAFMGQEAKMEAMKLAASLRAEGIPVLTTLGAKSLKAQLRQSNSTQAKYTIIIGSQELETGTVLLRNMQNKEQTSVMKTDIVNRLLRN